MLLFIKPSNAYPQCSTCPQWCIVHHFVAWCMLRHAPSNQGINQSIQSRVNHKNLCPYSESCVRTLKPTKLLRTHIVVHTAAGYCSMQACMLLLPDIPWLAQPSRLSFAKGFFFLLLLLTRTCAPSLLSACSELCALLIAASPRTTSAIAGLYLAFHQHVARAGIDCLAETRSRWEGIALCAWWLAQIQLVYR